MGIDTPVPGRGLGLGPPPPGPDRREPAGPARGARGEELHRTPPAEGGLALPLQPRRLPRRGPLLLLHPHGPRRPREGHGGGTAREGGGGHAGNPGEARPYLVIRSLRARCFPVSPADRTTCSGVPAATSRPPAFPAPGPRSITQSAAAMTSRLCSMTTTVFPRSVRRWSARSSTSTSEKCRPVVGSSITYSVRPCSTLPSSAASFSRWASPPESVVEDWPRARYPSPTSSRRDSSR